MLDVVEGLEFQVTGCQPNTRYLPKSRVFLRYPFLISGTAHRMDCGQIGMYHQNDDVDVSDPKDLDRWCEML